MSGLRLRLGGRTRLVLAGLAVLAASLLPALPARASDTVYYYSSDSLHSEVVITDQNRNVVERTHYSPYGEVLDRSLRDGPGYTGHAEDPGTGLVYMQQRYYDPQAGRFLSADPVQADPSSGANFNRYWYANDNPYRYTDPDGRDITEFIGGLFVETAHFVTGQGFNGSAVAGALVDGYNGEGGGVLHAALQDAFTASSVAGVAGAVKGAAALVGRLAAKQAVKEGAELASGASKSLKEQASELVVKNGGKNRVTIRSPSQKVEVDLAGKSHGGIETPHTKVSERNLSAPNQPAYNTKSATVRPSTQEDIRTARRYLDKDH